ncbi:MAG: YraN family protein [Candidatus Zambryskibacteria bacterium]|nr:YraN family protein [Candidatus Zambryskibacteria bacterium]
MKEKAPPKLRTKTQKQIVGAIGEDAVCVYLKRKGYTVTDRNYLKKWGELDVVARKGAKIYFVEVKSVSRPFDDVPRVTSESGYRPEDNMHPWKLKRLSRIIQSYLLDKNVPDEVEWQFDVATVYVDQAKRLCRVKMLEDVIL